MPISISINPSIASLARPEGLTLNLSDIIRRLAGLAEVVAVASIFAATFILIMAL